MPRRLYKTPLDTLRHADPHAVELLLGLVCAAWGGVLLLPYRLFGRDGYAGHDLITGNASWGEAAWGLMALLVGTLQLALFDFRPGLRRYGAAAVCGMFVAISSAFAGSCLINGTAPSTWLAVYPLAALGAGWSSWRT